jgi:signal transduction histidine kinase
LEPKRVKATDFMEDVLALARPKLDRHGIDLQKEVPPETGDIEIDENVAVPALLNIIENAVDACIQDRTKPARRIAVRVRPEADSLVFEIEDNGVGMSAEQRERIFDLFYSSKGQAGTGLGLFIARQVVRQHGGSIDVASAPGRGSCFRIRWPRVQSGVPEESSREGQRGG